MSRSFAEDWIAKNLQPGPFSRNDPVLAEHVVEKLLAAAAQAGVTREAIEQQVGPVAKFVEAALRQQK